MQPNELEALHRGTGRDLTAVGPVINPAMQRFRIVQPVATHFRPATCEEVSCDHWREGWMTIVTVGSAQEHYIRHDKTRRWTVRQAEGQADVLEFIFEPGQQCFREHQTTNGRLAIGLHETRGHRRVHQNGEDFMEHLHEETDKLSRAQ